MLTRNDLLRNKPLIISGPCSISSEEQIDGIAHAVKNVGCHALRAQLWKPRTSPNTFQGVGTKGVPWLRTVKSKYDIPLVIEVMSADHVAEVSDLADVLWVGARNMQNYSLLKELSKVPHPVILKRGLISTIKEWIGAATYIGLEKVIMCERGIRTGADSMRFTLDLNSALVVKHDYSLPIIVDPSHTAGRRDMVPMLAQAGIAAGADGIVVEAHTNPDEELVDKAQTITIETLQELVSDLYHIHSSINSTYAGESLVELRSLLDVIDSKIVHLLAQRHLVVGKVGEYKSKTNKPIVDVSRWREASERRNRLASSLDVSTELVYDIYELIHKHSIDSQKVLISSESASKNEK